jgi:hypothetical protein
MEFVSITRTTGFRHPVFGEGALLEDRTYYTFSQFARDLEAAGIGRIVRDHLVPPVPFRPVHLREREGMSKVLLMFSGGFGDAITLGIVIPAVIRKYGIDFDLCCDARKWESVFEPMGTPCRHVPFPPGADLLCAYDAILSRVEDFFASGDGLRTSPVINLAQGFGVDPGLLEAGYSIPPAIRDQWRLPHSGRIRIGINFDSNGRVKSYPEGLQPEFLSLFRAAGMELYILGTGRGPGGNAENPGIHDLRGRTTILECAALLEQMDAVIGVDSFVVHLAHLLGRPALVLLSTTAPAYFQWHRNIVCVNSRLECSPCFEFLDRCPLGRSACGAFLHESIAPSVILGQLAKILSDQFRKGLGDPPVVTAPYPDPMLKGEPL